MQRTLRHRSGRVKRRCVHGDSLRAMGLPAGRAGLLLLMTSALLTSTALPALAQLRGQPDAADFALAWARGSYASPVVCRFPDGAKRGLRRVLIAPGPKTSEQRVDRMQFMDLAAAGAERCADELGAEEPNVVGALYFTYTPRRPNSDTAERDFKHDVESGAVPFEVVRGLLRIGPAGSAADTLKEVDFAGGKLRIATIPPGSDDARRIADLAGGRRLRLEVEAKDGTRLGLALVEVERR